jgi:hypothetical protein
VLLSDHGMNDLGGHGGTALPEASTVALFVSVSAAALRDEGELPAHWPRRHARHDALAASQVDVAATLALLLGVPLPRASLGVGMPHVLLAAPLRTPRSRGAQSEPAFARERSAARVELLLRAWQINAEQLLNGNAQ